MKRAKSVLAWCVVFSDSAGEQLNAGCVSALRPWYRLAGTRIVRVEIREIAPRKRSKKHDAK